MKLCIFTILAVLMLSALCFGQSFSKNDLVVPKFSKESAAFDKVKIWQASSQYKIAVTKTTGDSYALNGVSAWKETGFPLLKNYKIDEIEIGKKKLGKVLLKAVGEQILITFEPDIDIQSALQILLFKGTPEELQKTDYFQNLEKEFLPKIFIGKLAAVPFESQRRLVKAFSYNLSSFVLTDFKEKSYLTLLIADTVIYNTIQINQAERASRKTQDALKLLSSVGKETGKVPEIEGIKITSEIHFKDFLKEQYTDGQTEKYEMYVSFDLLNKFINAEITNQELIDGSIIIVDGSRVKVNVTNFS